MGIEDVHDEATDNNDVDAAETPASASDDPVAEEFAADVKQVLDGQKNGIVAHW